MAVRQKFEFPFQLTFDGVPRAAALEEEVRGHVAHLPRFHPRIHGCWVVLGKAENRHQRGNRWRVLVRVAIPGNDVVVSRTPPRAEHEDPYLAIADAFRAVERKLEDAIRVRRGEVKRRQDELLEGRVVRLADDHGFIASEHGEEVYFHRNSIIGGEFDALQVGEPVRFAEEEGIEGPQASTVHPGG